VSQAFAGVSRIERHIGAARFEYREQRHHHADATLHAQRHAIFRTHAQLDQMMREPIGARIELRIRERLISKDQRDRIGRALDLLLEQLMNAQIDRVRRSRIVPRLDQ